MTARLEKKEKAKYVASTISNESVLKLSGSLGLLQARFEEQRQSGSKTIQARTKQRLKDSFDKKNRGIERRIKKDKFVKEDAETLRIKKLTDKANIYDDIQRGTFECEEGRESGDGIGGLLIPEYEDDSSISGSDLSENGDLVQIEDSFGRTRMVPRSKKHLYEAGYSGDEEDEHKTKRPKKLLRGDIIQADSFHIDQALANRVCQSEYIKSDMTRHYDSGWEIRDKGAGYYEFSQDDDVRKLEMQDLKQIRAETIERKKQDDVYDAEELCRRRLKDRIEAVNKQKQKTLTRLESLH